jgi:anti-sigma-K factor RskA
MMDERLEEQAALHVLGALTDAEAREFKQKLHADQELKEYVARLSTATGAVAGAVPAVEPPPRLRAEILARIAPLQKGHFLPERKLNPLTWLPWALGAALAALCIVLSMQDSRLRGTVREQAQQINSLNELAQSLSAATNTLQETVLALQGTNRLASLRIAMLNSLAADAPKAIAVSLWDNEKQNGVLVAQNLQALPVGKDYELWVMDENKNPVAAGVFHRDEHGAARVDFKPARAIKTAGQFCVTTEAKGGVSSPTLKNLVLASN